MKVHALSTSMLDRAAATARTAVAAAAAPPTAELRACLTAELRARSTADTFAAARAGATAPGARPRVGAAIAADASLTRELGALRATQNAAGPRPLRSPATDAITLPSLTVTRDPEAADLDADTTEITAGRAFLKANASAIADKLAALSPEQRAAYARVERSLVNPDGARDVPGGDQWPGAEKHYQASLARMLLDGRLTQKDQAGDKTVLDRLDQLATQPIAPGVTRHHTARELVEELHDPLAITQGGKGMCGAGVVAAMLARQSPADYAGLVADLARPEGTATLRDGSTIRRAEGFDTDLTQASTGRLLWPALMERANGDGQRYDFARDVNVPVPPGGAERAGLIALEIAELASAVTGRPFTAQFAVQNGQRSAELPADLRAALERGELVPAGLPSAGGQHAVLVSGAADGRVQFINPHGKAESVTEAEFAAGVHDYALPAPR